LRSIPVLLLLLAASCVEGGTEDRTVGEVQLSATHHLFGLRALGAFTVYPVSNTEVYPVDGLWTTFDDETYTVTDATGTTPSNRYALEKTGELAVLVSGSNRDPNVVFRGAYGLNGATNLYFFTDRTVTTASPSVGMFYGLRTVPGVADLAGSWHVFSLHFIFENTQVQDPRFVARTAYGTLAVAAGNVGDPLAVTGTGHESTSASLEYSGTFQALNDGAANLTLTYQQTGNPTTADSRVFQAAVNANALMAVDDITSGEAGALMGLRKRTGAVDPSALAGTYYVGAVTAFVNPRNHGTDGAFGTLSLTSQGAFRMAMVGANGADFTYQGTWTARTGTGEEGLLDFAVDGTQELWRGAVDEGYDTVMLVDDTIELRSNSTPELNLFLGLRQVETTGG